MQGTINSQIGEHIREKRLSLNMSLDELANLVDLSSGYLGLIERGDKGGTVETLSNIACALDMDAVELFKGIEKKQANPLTEKINQYLAYLDEEDAQFVLGLCKHLKSKNDRQDNMQ